MGYLFSIYKGRNITVAFIVVYSLETYLLLLYPIAMKGEFSFK